LGAGLREPFFVGLGFLLLFNRVS